MCMNKLLTASLIVLCAVMLGFGFNLWNAKAYADDFSSALPDTDGRTFQNSLSGTYSTPDLSTVLSGYNIVSTQAHLTDADGNEYGYTPVTGSTQDFAPVTFGEDPYVVTDLTGNVTPYYTYLTGLPDNISEFRFVSSTSVEVYDPPAGLDDNPYWQEILKGLIPTAFSFEVTAPYTTSFTFGYFITVTTDSGTYTTNTSFVTLNFNPVQNKTSVNVGLNSTYADNKQAYLDCFNLPANVDGINYTEEDFNIDDSGVDYNTLNSGGSTYNAVVTSKDEKLSFTVKVYVVIPASGYDFGLFYTDGTALLNGYDEFNPCPVPDIQYFINDTTSVTVYVVTNLPYCYFNQDLHSDYLTLGIYSQAGTFIENGQRYYVYALPISCSGYFSSAEEFSIQAFYGGVPTAPTYTSDPIYFTINCYCEEAPEISVAQDYFSYPVGTDLTTVWGRLTDNITGIWDFGFMQPYSDWDNAVITSDPVLNTNTPGIYHITYSFESPITHNVGYADKDVIVEITSSPLTANWGAVTQTGSGARVQDNDATGLPYGTGITGEFSVSGTNSGSAQCFLAASVGGGAFEDISGAITSLGSGEYTFVYNPSDFIGSLEFMVYAVYGGDISNTAYFTVNYIDNIPPVIYFTNDLNLGGMTLQKGTAENLRDYISGVYDEINIGLSTSDVKIYVNGIEITDDTYTFTTGGDFTVYTVTYWVTDGYNPVSVTVKFTAENTPPVANPIVAGDIDYTQPFTLVVAAADAYDPDGDTLTYFYTLSYKDADGNAYPFVPVSITNISYDNTELTFEFISAATLADMMQAYPALNLNFPFTVQFSYKVTDTAGASAENTITLVFVSNGIPLVSPPDITATNINNTYHVIDQNNLPAGWIVGGSEGVYYNRTGYFTATDWKGNSLTPVITGTVDVYAIKSYVLTYTFTDSLGGISAAQVTINITNGAPPVINLTKDNASRFADDTDIFNLYDYIIITDEEDGPISPADFDSLMGQGRLTIEVQKDGVPAGYPIDVSAAGVYDFVISFTDSDGNPSNEVEFTLTVKEPIPPVVDNTNEILNYVMYGAIGLVGIAGISVLTWVIVRKRKMRV